MKKLNFGKYGCYSFSKISTFQSCPMKFKFTYIDKIKIEDDNKALKKGSEIHSFLETFDYDKTPDYKTSEHSNIIDNFVNSNLGKEIFSHKSQNELGIAFDDNLEPYILDDFPQDKTMIFKGFIDRVNRTKDSIELIDFKTGKYKEIQYQDFTQLSLYALWFHKKFNIDKIRIRYVYVEHNIENDLTITNFDLIENNLINQINEIENSDIFLKKPTKLCNWCKFKDYCEKSCF